MPNFISEDQIEQALVQKLQHVHGFDALDCYTENAEDLNDGSGRANKCDVILADRVREAAIRLNPDIPTTAIEDALDKLLDRRQAMTLIAANREIYGLLRDGISVEFDNAQGVRCRFVLLQTHSGHASIIPYILRTKCHAMPATLPNERIDLRTSPEIKELIVRAASTAGVSVSAFLLGAAQERAKQILTENESITLTSRDWRAFVKALDNTEKPRPKLAAAMKRHRNWQKSKP